MFMICPQSVTQTLIDDLIFKVCLCVKVITQKRKHRSKKSTWTYRESVCLGDGVVKGSDGISCLQGRVDECECICGERQQMQQQMFFYF